MFGFGRNVIVVRLEEEIAQLRNEKKKLINEALTTNQRVKEMKEELEELKLKKKMELKEVEHLVKMAKEKNAVEFEKKVAEIEKNKQREISELQKNYYEKQMADLKTMTTEIMKRLPNVNMEIRKKR